MNGVVLSKIKEQLDKLDLDDEAKESLANWDFDAHASATRKAGKEQGLKQAAKMEAEKDAAIAELQEQIAELQEASEGASQKQTQAEKLAKDVEKLQKKLEASEAKAQEAESLRLTVERDRALEAIRVKNGISFTDQVALEISNGAWKSAFKDVDLDDADEVTEAVAKFQEANKALILTDPKGGTGDKKGDGVGAKGKLTLEQWKALPFKEQQERRAEVLAS